MTSAASIWAKLLLDRTEYNKGLNDAKSQTKDFTKSGKTGLGQLDEAFKSVTGQSLSAVTAWGLAAVAVKKVVQELAECEQAAAESAKADAKLNAVLESTGGVVGITSDELDRYATSLSKASGVDDELIKSAEAVMLTFTKIGQETFPGAMQAASDMAAVLGGDLQGKVTMIGKAMNDFSGYTALKRAGVSFTEEQIKQIANFKETNDLIGYQKLILGELSTEYGGAAKALNEAGDGSENLKVSFGNLQEAVGEDLIPVVKRWNELLTNVYDKSATTINRQREFGESMKRLGYTFLNSGVYIKDWKLITADAAKELVAAEQAARDAAEAHEGLAPEIHAANVSADELTTSLVSEKWALENLAPAAQLAEEQIAAITTANENMIKELGKWQTIETSHQDTLTGLYEEKKTLEEELATTRRNGYSEQSTQVTDILGKIEEIKTKIAEEKAAYELKTRTVILGYLQEKLAADGILTDEETEWLIAKGVEWGIYSQNAVNAYKAASAAADDFLNHRNNAEQDNSFTVTANYINNIVTNYTNEQGHGSSSGGYYSASSLEQRANGGTTVAGGLYHVNELGTPEILTVNNQDYLMMGSQSGVVTPLSDATSSNVSTSGGQSSYSAEMDWRRIARIIGEEVKMAVGR